MNPLLNINDLIPDTDIVFITLDALRYDVAQELFHENKLPNFSKWLPDSGWEERYSPASFTFPAHQAFFSGFLPTKISQQITNRLFAPQFYGSESVDENTFIFSEATITEALSNRGYDTVCIGGVGFFNKRNAISSVLPSLFQYSEWSEEMGVTEKESTRFQCETAISYLQEKPVFLFMNVAATHQPTNLYVKGAEQDTKETQKAALQYVDSQMSTLQQALNQRKRDQFIIVCSDHGTAYGEQEHWGHRNGHETVMKVPYLHYYNQR